MYQEAQKQRYRGKSEWGRHRMLHGERRWLNIVRKYREIVVRGLLEALGFVKLVLSKQMRMMLQL